MTGRARGLREVLVFGVVYLLYDASRWVFAGQVSAAAADARWIIDAERPWHVAFERPVQRALEWGVAEWLLSNVYLAAQLIVLPASLIWLYRRSPPVYRRLRNTVVVAWLVAVPIFALFPVAPPRLARHRHRRHREPSRGGRADRPLHHLLQPVRGRREPPCRPRIRRRGRGPCDVPRSPGPLACAAVGAARHLVRSGDRQPLRVRCRGRPVRDRSRLRGGAVEPLLERRRREAPRRVVPVPATRS